MMHKYSYILNALTAVSRLNGSSKVRQPTLFCPVIPRVTSVFPVVKTLKAAQAMFPGSPQCNALLFPDNTFS